MKFPEARAYIRSRRNPPHDDAGDDLDFVRLWERRYGYFTGIAIGGAVTFALHGYLPFTIFFVVASVRLVWLYRRFRAIHALFDKHASELERKHEDAIV